jgi:hypothetical protein
VPGMLLLVIPAKAGIQRLQAVAEALDPSFRWDDDLFRPSLNARLVPFERSTMK